MSKERALLRRVKVLLECSNMEPLQRQTDLIVGEIKELLAQPEQTEQEPKFNFDLERMKAAIESPISNVTVDDLVKQVKQEPVAWMFGNKLYKKLYGKNHLSLEERNSFIPLYTAPPKREPLSFEDLNTMWCGNPIDFARRIESIHGIGVDDEN